MQCHASTPLVCQVSSYFHLHQHRLGPNHLPCLTGFQTNHAPRYLRTRAPGRTQVRVESSRNKDLADLSKGRHAEVTVAEVGQATRSEGPVQQVLLSQDILPEIVACLEEISEATRWKDVIARLLVTNKAFFHAGIGSLWKSLDSLVPIFRLLPWFTTQSYTGVWVSSFVHGLACKPR
jgi:hypothetical protein